MITDSMERIGLYEGIIPYAKELEARYRSGDTDGLPFEVRHKQYETKPEEKRQYEVHFHTIDLMVGLDGAETIDLAPMSALQPGAPLPNGGDGMKLVGRRPGGHGSAGKRAVCCHLSGRSAPRRPGRPCLGRPRR